MNARPSADSCEAASVPVERRLTIQADAGPQELVLETQDGVFYPTDTSTLLIEAARASLTRPGTILDLGCGCGIVGLALAKCGLADGPVCGSDISAEAVALAETNARRLSVRYDGRCGSLFEPWAGRRFDVIVDDVAGVSDAIAEVSPWYPAGVKCNAGRDGTRWIVQIIRQSVHHLTEGGILLLPSLSLSCEARILEALDATYASYEVVAKRDWFLPEAIAKRTDVLVPLIEDGSIACERKFGRWIWSTSIYRAVR